MRWLILFLLPFSFYSACAQIYTPFPDSNAAWTGNRIDVTCNGVGNMCYINRFSLNGDTTIGPYFYKKVYEQISTQNGYFEGYAGAIRNDIAGKKVYYVEHNTTTDTLLYNFDLHVGDTISPTYIFPGIDQYPAIVDSIDSLHSWGQYRTRYNISVPGLNYTCAFIEGIGNTGGLMAGIFYPEGSASLFCFIQNDTIFYPEGNNSNLAQCNFFVSQTPDCSDTTYMPLITASGPLTLCHDDTIILEAETGYDSYLWSTGETTQSISASDSGDYFVSALVDTCWFNSDTLKINISEPMPYIIVNFYELICTPSFTSYQWYLFNDTIEGATNQSYCALENGEYYVVVTDIYGCTGISAPIEHTPCCVDKQSPCDIGIQDINKLAIDLYPNPANNSVTIEFFELEKYKNAELSILNITGELILQSSINNPRSTINIAHFSKGLYYFKVSAGDTFIVKKVVVEW